MKNFIFCLSFLGLASFFANAQETSVLFIGNSYIYTGDLPETLKSLALAGGDSIYHESNTPGGYTFQGHSTNATTLGKIASREWDFVVLQEQSQMPSFPPSQVASQTYPYAEILVDSIKSNYECTEPIFFMTWGRKDGDQSNCAGYPPLCTFEGMNARLRESYLEMGVDNEATVAPCGAAWLQMSVDDNFFWNGLYSGDGSHPSAWGTYLNACVFYATIYRKSPVGIEYYSSIGQQDAEDLQQLAEDIVLDSLSNWFIGHQDVVSNASHNINSGLTVDFMGSSLNATNHYWEFGDGGTSNQENTQYTFPNAGTYSVTHIASSDCDADTTVFEVNLSPSSIEEGSLSNLELLAVNGALSLKNVLTSVVQLNVFDYAGREVLATEINSETTTRIELQLPTGIYLCRISDGKRQLTRKVFLD
ncbi:MAG: T9SS type A sorting domain-containing protein [Flavobacteriales bacterium]|nr:T9SS type A sorting domain-containing protein [Flavobacteriales bacterium]